MASYYKKSATFTFSLNDLPNAVSEALSYGLPVVTFDCIVAIRYDIRE
jgi:glycosyltransferase involved in cell wall biosynthesis